MEYLSKRIVKIYKKEFYSIVQGLKEELGDEWNFHYYLVGSASRNMVVKSNEGFDLDFHLMLKNWPDELSDEEIVKIENGMTSITSGYRAKIQEVVYQWQMWKNGGDPNGHSLLQRAEHMSIAWALVKKHWLTGVGMGDVPNAFEKEYIDSGSKLAPEYWHRSHNQFLTLWISHGIIGLICILAMFIVPIVQRTNKDYFYWVVFLALSCAMFFQDMLETQAGVTIFGLFYGLTVYKEDSSFSSESNASAEEE